jgi:hypothetical protein
MHQSTFTNQPTLLEQFTGALETHGVQHEVHPQDEYHTLIGLTAGLGLWHWFTYACYSDEQFLLFKESHSSDQTYNSTTHRLWAYEHVEELTGFDFFPEIAKAEVCL